VLARWLPQEKHPRHVEAEPDFGALLRHLRNPRLLATFAIGFNVLFSLVGIFTYITFYLAAPPFRLSTLAAGI
jgi:YNFM family putative membrane transporter